VRPPAPEVLIDSIYEAAFLPERWPETLDAFGHLGGGVGGVMFTTDHRRVTRWAASDGLRSLVEAFIAGDWVTRNPRLAPAAWVHGAVGFVRETDYLTPDEIASAPMYRELLRPRGFGSHVGTAILLPSGDAAVMNIERPAGPATGAEVARLDAVRPHLARAALVATRLGLERAKGQVEALAALDLPAAVLGSGGRVLASNDLLERASRQVVVRAFDRVALVRPAAHALLADALAQVEAGRLDATASVPLPRTGDLPPSVVHVVPVRRQAHDIFAQAHAILVLTPLAGGKAPSAELLTGLFDLTPAEARVARAVTGGRTVDETAAALGVSPATVRTQLKAVLSKTGTRRQAELVRLLSSGIR
jgi:DNA-binding CsgD family transcriptional regulator